MARLLESFLPDRIARRLRTRSAEQAWERSRTRWRAARPTTDLTWGYEVTGDAFVERAEAHGAFGEAKSLLEVGPGYGRLLTACLERRVGFESYLGVDLSEDNVRHLRERFRQPNVRFVCGDVEAVRLDAPVDSVISSATFKHLFPSFEVALRNLSAQMRAGAVVVFDLIEGERSYFEDDGVTFIRWYTRDEIEAIARRAGLEPVAFDQVRHIAELVRLLVVVRKPS